MFFYLKLLNIVYQYEISIENQTAIKKMIIAK